MSDPRAPSQERPLLSDEVRPCSICGAVALEVLDEERHLAVNIFDALPPHAVAARYTRPIHTPHNAHPSTYSTFTAKPPVKTIKPGGFALGPQTMLSIGGDISIVGAVEPGRKS